MLGDLTTYFVTTVFTYGAAFTPEVNNTSIRFALSVRTQVPRRVANGIALPLRATDRAVRAVLRSRVDLVTQTAGLRIL